MSRFLELWGSIMAFKKDIAEYKSYSEEEFYMHSVPDNVWSELTGLIGRYADNSGTLNVKSK